MDTRGLIHVLILKTLRLEIVYLFKPFVKLASLLQVQVNLNNLFT